MKILIDIVIVLVLSVTSVFLYQNYWDDVLYALYGDEPTYTVYLGAKALEVTIADEPSERVAGLSGVESLRDFQGKLFIFDTDAQHRIWMKDMKFALDIIWIDKNLQVIHMW